MHNFYIQRRLWVCVCMWIKSGNREKHKKKVKRGRNYFRWHLFLWAFWWTPSQALSVLTCRGLLAFSPVFSPHLCDPPEVCLRAGSITIPLKLAADTASLLGPGPDLLSHIPSGGDQASVFPQARQVLECTGRFQEDQGVPVPSDVFCELVLGRDEMIQKLRVNTWKYLC